MKSEEACSSELRRYDKDLAEAGALVCWENGEGLLRYVGPTTDASACGCFIWLAGPHKGTYATYKAGDLRMAPAGFRPDGWYWVRMLGWGGQYESWVPAEWSQSSRSWASSRFSGIPESHMRVGTALIPPSQDAASSAGTAPPGLTPWTLTEEALIARQRVLEDELEANEQEHRAYDEELQMVYAEQDRRRK